jgi:hypothetical protein
MSVVIRVLMTTLRVIVLLILHYGYLSARLIFLIVRSVIADGIRTCLPDETGDPVSSLVTEE